MPVLKIKTTEIYYEIHGQGPPLLLVAGMSSDSKSWQFIQDEIRDHFTLITIDNRGCGRTTYEGSFTLADIADDAIAILDHLKYEKVDVVGHSMGGMIVQEMALKYPNRINKLILASTSIRIPQSAAVILDDLLLKWQQSFDMAEWFRIMFTYLFTPKALKNSKFIDAAIIFALAYPYPQTLEGFTDQVNAIKDFDATERIQNIIHDTLILSGEEDILFTQSDSKTLNNIGGASIFKVIEGAAHSIHAEKPKVFSRELIQFLFD